MAKAKKYILAGSSQLGENVERIVLKGSSAVPEEWIDGSTPGELSDDEVARLRATGHVLLEVDEPDLEKTEDNKEKDDSADESKKAESQKRGEK